MKIATLDKYKPLIMTDTFELRFEHKINWSYGECQLQDYLSTFLKIKKKYLPSTSDTNTASP
jgi:hypothetical protein